MTGSKRATIKLKNILPLLGLALLLIGGGVALVLVRQNQEIRQQAFEPPLANTCVATLDVAKSSLNGKCSVDSDCTCSVGGDCTSPLVCSGATATALGTCQNPPPGAFTCATVTTIPVDECQALVALYKATDGKNWKYQLGWMSNNDPCTWNVAGVDNNNNTGVHCSAGHVKFIALVSNNLNGAIPQEMKSLANLTFLDLSSNKLKSIPPELGNLPNLTDLMLDNNQLKSIPPELGNLPNLAALILSNNQLKSIPPELGNLPNLIDLYLYNNQLVGEIPSSFSELKNIKTFYFKAGNQLCLPTTLEAWITAIPASQRDTIVATDYCQQPPNDPPPPTEKGQVVGYVFYDADRDGVWDCEIKSGTKTGPECVWPGVNDSHRWQIAVKSAVDNSEVINTNATSGGWYETSATQKLNAGDYHVTLSPNNTSESYSYTTSRFVTTHVGKKPGKDFVNGRADFGVIPTRLVPTPPIDQCAGKDRADFDCNGDVDIDDYKTLIQNFDF